jgi:hypothetical protein
MSDVQQLLQLQPVPGIQRDGTDFDVKGLGYIDGQWVRFQRGKPRKMGGFIRVSDRLSAPVRASIVTPYNGTARILSFSVRGIESILVDDNGLGSFIVDRTPSLFSQNDNYMWSVDTMYDDAAGANQSIVLAVATESLQALDTINVGQVYQGNVFNETVFTEVAGLTCRGLFVTQPYAVYYGPNGSVTWSNANEPFNTTTGDAGSDRVTSDGIVAGLPLPTGSGPGGLLFSLSSVIRMDWVGGQAIFRFSKLTTSSSIISQNAAVEFDGGYFWAGVDKFYVSDGNSVTELENNTNKNWFFDNLNRSQSTKVWATKNARFAEVIWHFPYGDNDECSHAVVFNIREKVWYDYELSRTAGSQYKQFPVQYNTPSVELFRVVVANATAPIVEDALVKVDNGGAVFKVVSVQGSVLFLEPTNNVEVTAGLILYIIGGGTADIITYTETCGLFLHEFGKDRIEGDFFYAIPSSVTTSNISLLSMEQSTNRWTRLLRIEPDFIQTNGMSVQVLTKEFPSSPEISAGIFPYEATTEKIDMRVQGRLISLKFESNVSGGDFQMGKCLLHLEPGDPRS